MSKTFDGVRVLDDLTLRIDRGTVHALLGGNGSGKSTTLKVLAGVYEADPGSRITVGDLEYDAHAYSPTKAFEAGLRFVHQDLGLIETLTIAENFGLVDGFPLTPLRGIRWSRLRERTRSAMDAMELDLDPDTLVGALQPSERTLVAIARALGSSGINPGITIVLDEPTASLPQAEVELLLSALQRCRERGQTIVYVSHRLPEVFRIADRVSVLRDGVLVADQAAAELDEQRVVQLMAGNDALAVERHAPPSIIDHSVPPLLRIAGLTCGPVADLSLQARPGEIVGIAGLIGSGRSTVLRALFGQIRARSGRIELGGVPFSPRDARAAMAAGVAFVPEDRKRDAAFLDRPVWENISAAVLSSYWRRGRVQAGAERADSRVLMNEFSVKSADADVPIGALSGGNQQKAILARWLRRNPRLLLLDEPSQGVDAVARAEIHESLRRHVSDGHAALVVSSDFAELAALCHRVVVLRGGRLGGELSAAELDEERITYLTQFEAPEKNDD